MAARTSTDHDADFSNKIETNSRIVRWTVHTNMQLLDKISQRTGMDKSSHVFKMGKWNWKLYFVNSVSTFAPGGFFFGLDPIKSKSDPLIASFSIRVLCNNQFYQTTRQEIAIVKDPELMFYSDKVYWKAIIGSYIGEFIVEVEFFDLKTIDLYSGEICSIWSRELSKKQLHQDALMASVCRLLSDNILTDVTISTSDGGKFNAHRAILASRSSVFRTMFSHDLQEKKLSTITMSDISAGACKALIDYIYGNMKANDLTTHLFELLRAAHKYDFPELLHECHECLTDDINQQNVLEMLQTANLYGLPELKNRCLKYLVKFGRIFEINKEDLDEFFENGDKEHIVEILREILKEWKTIKSF